MNYQIVFVLATVPLFCGLVFFVYNALKWRSRMVMCESELEAVRQELASKKNKLENAKEGMEKFTKTLEERMKARTAELRQAQDEIERLRSE